MKYPKKHGKTHKFCSRCNSVMVMKGATVYKFDPETGKPIYRQRWECPNYGQDYDMGMRIGLKTRESLHDRVYFYTK